MKRVAPYGAPLCPAGLTANVAAALAADVIATALAATVVAVALTA